jgi:hypothetical protein
MREKTLETADHIPKVKAKALDSIGKRPVKSTSSNIAAQIPQ